MNKQRKVVITITYNEMGIIIDTKAEELDSSAQPEIIRCRDCFKREICRTTRIWAVAPSDDWFCADGERLPLPEPLRGEKHETD